MERPDDGSPFLLRVGHCMGLLRTLHTGLAACLLAFLWTASACAQEAASRPADEWANLASQRLRDGDRAGAHRVADRGAGGAVGGRLGGDAGGGLARLHINYWSGAAYACRRAQRAQGSLKRGAAHHKVRHVAARCKRNK